MCYVSSRSARVPDFFFVLTWTLKWKVNSNFTFEMHVIYYKHAWKNTEISCWVGRYRSPLEVWPHFEHCVQLWVHNIKRILRYVNTLRGGQQRWWKGWKACPRWVEVVRLDNRKNFFTVRVVKQCFRLPRRGLFPIHVSVQEAFG